MYLGEAWSGRRLRGIVGLALGAGLGACALIPNVLDIPSSEWSAYTIVGVVLWVLLFAWALAIVAFGRFRFSAWAEATPLAVLLAGVFQMYFRIFGEWSGDIAVLCFIAFFIFELRSVIKRHPTLYALAAVIVVMVLTGLVLAEAEQDEPGAEIKSGGQALYWVASQIFRFGVLAEVKPISPSGNLLGVVAIVSGVLFAAVLFSAVTAWAVGESTEAQNRATTRIVRAAVRQALIDAGVAVAPDAPEPSGPRLLIDVDRVVGSEMSTWWFARGPSIERYVSAAPDDASIRHAARVLERRPVLLVARQSGAWPDETDPDVELGPDIELVLTDDPIEEWLGSHAAATDVVVTGGSAHDEAVQGADARLLSVRDFLAGDVVAPAGGA